MTNDQVKRLYDHDRSAAERDHYRAVTAAEDEAALLDDLRFLATPPGVHDKRVGYAWWDGATGDYTMLLGRGNRTVGTGGATDLVDAIDRHGLRSSDWATDGPLIRCTLHALDWSLAP